jgi:hypothetical protein
MRRVIVGVASLIEDRKYKSAEEAIGQMQLAYVDRQRAIALVQADKRLHISYQALKTTIEFFANLNQVIIAKISMTPSPQMETEMVLGNAILVYELTDFVISYIEGFAVDGVADIVQLHEETKRKITDIRRQQTSLEQLVKSEAIDAAVRDQTLEDIASRAKSLNLLEQEWHVYIDSIQALDAEIGSIRRKISTLEVIRENARIQIELIQAVAMLQFLKKNIGTIEATVLTLERIKLVSLSPNRVRRLLGIN